MATRAPPWFSNPSSMEGRPPGVEGTFSRLTLREAVGQLVFPWISGAYAAEDDPELLEVLEWVERWGIGGVVISIGTPHAYAAKLNTLQERADVPLLVTSDFENGGPGMRINHSYALPTLLPQGGGTSFPPTMAFGAVGDEEVVERFARITAREARAVGVHLNFAPVLDVNSNPENPIINTRAFGEAPDDVARAWSRLHPWGSAGGCANDGKALPWARRHSRRFASRPTGSDGRPGSAGSRRADSVPGRGERGGRRRDDRACLRPQNPRP